MINHAWLYSYLQGASIVVPTVNKADVSARVKGHF